MGNLRAAPLLLLLLLLGPAVRAAPRAGGHRPETLDLLSPELPTLPLLQSAVRSLGLPERDAEAMTREQALLYLFVLHDHDRSGHLDGLELLQLLGTVLAQRDGGHPDPEVVAALVDRALERQDLSGDGLLNPPELLLLPGPGQGPPGQPLLQPPGELLAGAGAAPGGDLGVSGPAHGPAEGQAAPQAGAPQAGAMEAEEAPQAGAPQAGALEVEEAPQAGAPQAGAIEAEEAPKGEAPDAGAMEAEEAPQAGAPEGEAAPVWGDPGEG